MKRPLITLTTAIFSSAIVISGLSVRAQSQNGFPGATVTASPSVTTTGTPRFVTPLQALSDTTLLNYIHYLNSTEVAVANNALQNLANQQAIDYAQRMITEHQNGEQALNQLATQKGITLYAYQPSTVDIATVSELETLSGPQYDLAYIQIQLTEHQKALQDLMLLQKQVTDPEINNLVNQTIPVIQQHIDAANAIIGGLAAGGGAAPTGTPTGAISPSPSVSQSISPTPSPTETFNGTPGAAPTPEGAPTPSVTTIVIEN